MDHRLAAPIFSATVAVFGVLICNVVIVRCQVPIHPSQVANRLDEPLMFDCPEGQAIYQVKSNFFRRMNDRVWEFKCRDFPFKNETDVMCDPHSVVMANEMDGPLNYMCPRTGIWTGVMSAHNNEHEDRQWSFKCCSHDNYCRHNCYMSGPLNDYQGMLNFTVSQEHEFVVGIFSMHNNRYEDRRWSFEVCKIELCGM